jgi:4-amino-4-deoxychorismate lyase
MSRFLESISIIDGQIQRLPWHQHRVDHSLNAFYKGATLDLYAAIGERARLQKGTVKCRVLYDFDSCEIQFLEYSPRNIKTLKLVENNEIEYAFKFADRSAINAAFGQRDSHDDILIVKNGKITDSSISNIAFRRDEKWFTPREPLLKGTMRQYLLERGALTEADITARDLLSFHGYKLINALLAFASDEYPVSNIHF